MEKTKAEIMEIVWAMRQTQKLTEAMTGVRFTDKEMVDFNGLPAEVLNYCN